MQVAKIWSASLPVPQASSGLVAGRPGSSTAASRSRVASEMPAETTRLKRRPRRLWSRAENTDPEWLTTATGPGTRCGGSG